MFCVCELYVYYGLSVVWCLIFFFCKQKTAYEFRISDWSSDVCSSDLHYTVGQRRGIEIGGQAEPLHVVRLDAEAKRVVVGPRHSLAVSGARLGEVNWPIGRASGRERVCQYVSISVDAGT